MTHTDLPAEPVDRSTHSTDGRNPYPTRPDWWAPGKGGCGSCGCGAWWAGWNTCHCMGCHRTFTSQSASDKHRAGSHERDTRHCIDPATVHNRKGERVLVDAGRDYPCWGFPAGDKWWGDEDGAA